MIDNDVVSAWVPMHEGADAETALTKKPAQPVSRIPSMPANPAARRDRDPLTPSVYCPLAASADSGFRFSVI